MYPHLRWTFQQAVHQNTMYRPPRWAKHQEHTTTWHILSIFTYLPRRTLYRLQVVPTVRCTSDQVHRQLNLLVTRCERWKVYRGSSLHVIRCRGDRGYECAGCGVYRYQDVQIFTRCLDVQVMSSISSQAQAARHLPTVTHQRHTTRSMGVAPRPQLLQKLFSLLHGVDVLQPPHEQVNHVHQLLNAQAVWCRLQVVKSINC